jgi:AcrR family transcriptional regulator
METKSRLIAIGRKLFAAQGHSGVSMENLCARAAVTRGALYHHFPGKNDLFRAVCEAVATDVTNRVVAKTADLPDPWERLLFGCEVFLESCEEDSVRQILLTDAPSVLGWTAYREIDDRHGLGLVKSAIAQAVGDGSMSVDSDSIEILAHFLVSALNEAAMIVGKAEDPVQARRRSLAIIHGLLKGFKKIPGARPSLQ